MRQVYDSLGDRPRGWVLLVTAGAWMLRGERSLWTGRAARARVTRGAAGEALYQVAALVAVAAAAFFWLRQVPVIFVVLAAIAWGGGALQSLWALATVLVIGPASLRRTAYEVTSYRVIVSGGRGAGNFRSVYLDQIGVPTVRRHRDGTGDVLLPARRVVRRGSSLDRLLQGSGIGAQTLLPVTGLRAVADAEQACQIIAGAQRRMREDEEDALPPLAPSAGPSVPVEVALARGEDVLWTGAAGRLPWWYSGGDLYLTVFGLFFVAFAVGLGFLVGLAGGPLFLIWVGLLALAGGVYPGVGRLVHRRLLIRRSRYVLTSRRLIATWQPLLGGAPVVAQAPLGALLPPAVRGPLMMTGLAAPDDSSQRRGWRGLTWPASVITPPVFVGLANPAEVASLIGDAQVAARARVSR